MPSMEVYLHAVECKDLFYPNPPNPVTTSCGVVALYHDIAARFVNIFITLYNYGKWQYWHDVCYLFVILMSHNMALPEVNETPTVFKCLLFIEILKQFKGT